MTILESMTERIQRLGAFEELKVDRAALPAAAVGLSGESVMLLLAEVAALMNDVGLVQSVLAGVAAQRSRREDGHSGLAAVHGHATPAGLIQSITGGTRADATRHVRVGGALLEGAEDLPRPDASPVEPPAKPPWHEPLRRALLGGELTTAQADAIRRGLGEPVAREGMDACAADEVWSLAAEQLIAEAGQMSAEELVKRARGLRDVLDPVGAAERFDRHFDERAFHLWVDADGRHRGRIDFDDEMGIWARTLIDAGLRPRRGGPRFVSDDERSAAADLVDDPRSNDQLQYDLLMDVLRAGALASAADVFGTRQPGVRIVVVKDLVGPRDAFGRLLAVAHAEDGGDPLPGPVLDRALCSNGSLDVTVDPHGNPLDLGREHRLYSTRQRVALAIRDGGCLFPGCQRAASYCEAHHIDNYSRGGCTNLDRGVLLCRFHHMLLHNNGWCITRDGSGPFVLHPPPGRGDPIELQSKSAWKWAWDPPPPPDRQGWRARPAPLARVEERAEAVPAA